MNIFVETNIFDERREEPPGAECFGHDRRWNRPLNLYGRLNVPEELKPCVSDYRIVADYFSQMRKNIRITGDDGHESAYGREMERGRTTMCKALDKVESREIEKGIEALILDNIENGFDWAKIVAKVVKRFGVSEEEAEGYSAKRISRDSGVKGYTDVKQMFREFVRFTPRYGEDRRTRDGLSYRIKEVEVALAREFAVDMELSGLDGAP